MGKVTLYIAVSLDGYIADKNGGVDWLKGQGDGEDIDTYSEFVREVDRVVMGWKTYHQIVTKLSPDQWVYEDLTSYVITHRAEPSTEKIKFVSEDPCRVVRALKEKPGEGIWICGGASIVQALMEEDLIDEYYISVIPTLLGAGIPLWGERDRERQLKLLRTRAYNGIVELVYARR